MRCLTRLPLLAGTAVGLVLAGCAGNIELSPVQSSYEEPSNVAVYFRVGTRGGEPVPGLKAEQFEIYEDGRLVSTYESQQTILNPEVAASHYTLLLIDMSGSVAQSDDMESVVEAAKLFAERVESNNKVAIYAFDGEAEPHKISDFTGSASSADARARSLAQFKPEDPSTNLHGAVVAGLKILDDALADAENPLRFGTLVVFSDGTDRASRVSEDDMLDAIDASEHEVFAIGLGAEISEQHLGRIGQDGTALAEDRSQVVEAFDTVAKRIEGITKSYYLLSYCSPSRAAEHEVRIEAVIQDEKGKERRGALDTRFDAAGFRSGCDPNQAPKFDVSQGEIVAD